MTAATEWWNRFPVTVSFLEPCEVVGTIEHLGTFETRDGAIPQVRIKTDQGSIVTVNAAQTRLLAELVRLAPAVGDRIWIKYLGPAKKAPAGLSPTKEFAVAVTTKDGEVKK